jgi:hypothetical protein
MPIPLPIMMNIATTVTQCQTRVASRWRLIVTGGEGSFMLGLRSSQSNLNLAGIRA